MQLAMPAAALLVVATAAILPTGYFGPLSSRVRGLFLKHTRTGNPLVPASWRSSRAVPRRHLIRV